MKKISLMLVLVMILSAFMAGCGDSGADSGALPEKIIVGVFEPLTGANAGGGELELQGIELAHEMFPTVTIDGTEIPVELAIADNKSDKTEASNAARNLVDSKGAHIVVGSWGSGFSMAAGPIFEDSEVPAIGTSCTNPLVTKGMPYYFRVCFIDPFQGTVMAKYAFDEGFKKIAIVQEVSNDYAVSLAAFFKDAFTELTGDESCIVSTLNYNTNDQDFSAQLTDIKNSGAEAIFAPGNFTETALLMKQARELGIDLQFLGGDTWETPPLLEIAGEAAEGAVYSSFYDPAAPLTEMTATFLDAYAAKYGDEQPAGVTACGFDAYLLALDAIQRAGSADGPAVRDALAETKDFEGAAGFVTLDENGDAIKPAVIKTVKDGQFVYKSFVEPF
ncbi:MAG: ABC transporter substrate-binding protein [Anaerovorax sp.]|nr:ABC transporter substrate-binding protein [Anaerovorax sp.]